MKVWYLWIYLQKAEEFSICEDDMADGQEDSFTEENDGFIANSACWVFESLAFWPNEDCFFSFVERMVSINNEELFFITRIVNYALRDVIMTKKFFWTTF